MRFDNREDSGFHLSALLLEKKIKADYVITIPRGGVPVAAVISKKLQLPLKLVFVRKLGHPINSEFAIGAVSEKNLIINNDVFINNQHPEIESLIQKERKRILEMEKQKRPIRDAARNRLYQNLPSSANLVLIPQAYLLTISPAHYQLGIDRLAWLWTCFWNCT